MFWDSRSGRFDYALAAIYYGCVSNERLKTTAAFILIRVAVSQDEYEFGGDSFSMAIEGNGHKKERAGGRGHCQTWVFPAELEFL